MFPAFFVSIKQEQKHGLFSSSGTKTLKLARSSTKLLSLQHIFFENTP